MAIRLLAAGKSAAIGHNDPRRHLMSRLVPLSDDLKSQGVVDLPELMQAIRARTPARILVGRAGPAYPTATQLELRQDHAAALDAVHAELDLLKDFGQEFVERWRLFEVTSQATSKTEHLMRPDLGRRLHEAGR